MNLVQEIKPGKEQGCQRVISNVNSVNCSCLRFLGAHASEWEGNGARMEGELIPVCNRLNLALCGRETPIYAINNAKRSPVVQASKFTTMGNHRDISIPFHKQCSVSDLKSKPT